MNAGATARQAKRQPLPHAPKEHNPTPPLPADEIPENVTPELVQRCLKEAGYLKTEVRDRMTPEAWTAFWYFKQDYDVGPTRDGIKNPRFQARVFTLCPRTTGTVTDAAQEGTVEDHSTSPEAESGTAAAKAEPDQIPPSAPIYNKPELDCLPQDLYRLVVETYGPRPELKQCSQTCIAKPRGLSKAEIEDYANRQGIKWCDACIEISSYLPLDEILRIERGTDAQICARPPARLPRWGQAAAVPHQPYTKVRAIYRAFRPAIAFGNRIAVVIGNRTYDEGLSINETAHNNAGAIYALLTEHLGMTSEDIIDLRDATQQDLKDVFASDGLLQELMQQRPDADVLIYYAGRATSSVNQSESYLLPVDANAYREESTGFPLSELYADLRRLNARSVLLLLETDFARDQSDFVFPPNLPELKVRILPAEPVSGLTVISATEGDQKALDDPSYGVGLFTRYLVEGLAGQADHPPVGNGDGNVEAVELYVFTAHMVRLAARKSYGLVQKPTLSRQGNIVLSRELAQTQ